MGSDEYNVRSYFFYKRSRASEHKTEEIIGEREDVIRKEEGNGRFPEGLSIPIRLY